MDEWEHQSKKKRQKRLINYTLVGLEENYFCALEESVRNLNNLILQTKLYYQQNLGKKLNDPTLQSKTYRFISKGFYNGFLLLIAPLLVNSKFMTDFKAKTNIFSDISADSAHL